MINRKEEQGSDAISSIKKEVGADAKIEWVPCDLGSLKEVKKVFTELREKEERLDLVSPNPPKDSPTREGGKVMLIR
jgi:short-subunit dehydrogenase